MAAADAAADALINISHLYKKYTLGDSNTIINALFDVSFEIFRGEIVFITGPSGSGKTTLVNLIGGIDSASEGTIEISDVDITHFSDKRLTQYRKKRLAFVFQFYSLIPTLTTMENVELTLELTGKKRKEIREVAKNFLELVGLGERMENYPAQLSGGERQRVAIARALAKNPEILLVDEPTGQLDQKTGENIVELIRKVSKVQHITVILVTHDQNLVKYADRVIELRSGQIFSDKYCEAPPSRLSISVEIVN